jgi:hypothetical protein
MHLPPSAQRRICLIIASAALLVASLACNLSPPSDTPALMLTLQAENAQQATQIAQQGTVVAHLATRVGAFPPPTSGPPPTKTPEAALTAPVIIEDGRCCAGGTAGETITLDVDFEAAGLPTAATEMRVRTRTGRPFTAEEMAQADWEPFAPQKSYPVGVVNNWIGFYVSVQYRDAEGNVSPVYHDDISVEGHPPDPTP